jgi:hypothetical protein
VCRSGPDKFLYVFKTGPSRARERAATTGRDRLPATPLRYVLGASLGLARTCQQGAGPKTADSPSTLDTLWVHHSPERRPTLDPLPNTARLPVGSRIAPLAIMEGTVRHGTRQGRLRRPSGIFDP